MISSSRIRRLFSSPIFLFIYFSLFFGVIMQLLTAYARPFSWSYGFVFGIPVGLAMTFLVLRRIRKFKESLGITDQEQLDALGSATRTGTVPSDPQIRKLLPAYLQKQFPIHKRPGKGGIIFIGVVVAMNILTAVANHNLIRAVVSVAFLAVMTGAYWFTRRTWARVDKLYEQLGIDPTLPASVPIPQHYPHIPDDSQKEASSKPQYPAGLDQPIDTEERDRSKWVLIAALVVGVAIFVLFTKPAPQPAPEPIQESPAVTSAESQSNETVGTVEENADESLNPASVPIDPSGTSPTPQNGDDLQGEPVHDGAVHQYTVDGEPTN